jgi:uncharacterized membrane protein
MNSILLPLHLSCIGVWLGCILTETLFERALLGKGREQELILVGLHKRVDLFVEIPAFSAVLITGALILPMAKDSGLLHLKIALGLLAIATNIYCVRLVFQRADAATRGEWEAFSRLDHKQHLYGAVVLLAIVLALIVGIALYGSAWGTSD